MNLYKKFQMPIIILSFLCVFSLLTGCASMNSNFTCPMKPGQMCNSLDEVNTMVDQGIVGSNKVTANSSKKDYSANSMDDYPMSAITAGEPLRIGDSVLRIWVVPYEDQASNYYLPSFMYAVVRSNHWIGNPVQTTTRND